MMDINAHLLHYFINFLIKKLQLEQSKVQLFVMKNQQKNYPNQALENLRKEMYIPFMDNIWGSDFKRTRFFYVLLIFIGNMYMLIPLRDTK